MRRLLSILLLAAFALPLVAPLFALGQDPDAGLPACCRRHGQHHCLMLEQGKDPSAHKFVAVCPVWPQRAVPASLVSHHFVEPVSTSAIAFHTSALSTATRERHPQHLKGRQHSQRGPPASTPAIA